MFLSSVSSLVLYLARDKCAEFLRCSDHILFTVNWWQTSHVVATWTNRVQNESQLIMYDTKGNGSPILNNEETEGWLQPKRLIKIGNYALLLRMEDSGTTAGRFQHVTR